jgi:DNA replication initiation complex subunit (GINS family)
LEKYYNFELQIHYRARIMKKKIEKPQREKREENEKRIKRFDPILKEIFSKSAGKIISIAVGEQIHQKIEDITSEIEFVKSLRPDMVFRARKKIFSH